MALARDASVHLVPPGPLSRFFHTHQWKPYLQNRGPLSNEYRMQPIARRLGERVATSEGWNGSSAQRRVCRAPPPST